MGLWSILSPRPTASSAVLAQSRGRLVRFRKTGKVGDDLQQLSPEVFQAVPVENDVGVIGDIAAGGAQMDDTGGGGRGLAVGIHVGHHVVADFLFPCRGTGTVPAEGVRVYNRSEYVSDYLLRGNTRCWSVLYRRSAIGQIRFREDLSIGEDMMFLMDLLMQISRVSITEYRGYFYRINEQGAMLKPFKPSYMDEIKSWELACRLVEKEFPSQKGRVYSILAVSAMLAAGKIARLPGVERKKYRTEVAQCRSAVQKGLAASRAKEEHV